MVPLGMAAIRNSGFGFPFQKITVNLAPADMKKEGSAFDLPMAIGILGSLGMLARSDLSDVVWRTEGPCRTQAGIGGQQSADGVDPRRLETFFTRLRDGAASVYCFYDGSFAAAVLLLILT